MPNAQRQVARRAPSTDVVKAQIEETRKLLVSFENDLTKIMPRHVSPETFMGLALAACRRDEKLRLAAKVNPGSFIMALRRCAYLGHVVTRGQFALVPFKDKDDGMAIAGIEEYQGLIARMYRSGMVASIGANVGRENDPVCRWNPTTMTMPLHEFDEFADPTTRGALKVAYAWANLTTGGTIVSWLPTWAVLRRKPRWASVEFWGPEHPDEGPNTEPMWKKSALNALESTVPTSVGYLESTNNQLAAATTVSGVHDLAAMTTEPDPGWIDGEVVEPGDTGWPETVRPPEPQS
jgi:recombinational DNA repair protein RecT